MIRRVGLHPYCWPGLGKPLAIRSNWIVRFIGWTSVAMHALEAAVTRVARIPVTDKLA
jgi:hypothetical protein